MGMLIAASARDGLKGSAVWTGSKLLVWGGWYDTAPLGASSWQPLATADAPTPRCCGGMTWDGSSTA